jgi:hypothetical protein
MAQEVNLRDIKEKEALERRNYAFSILNGFAEISPVFPTDIDISKDTWVKLS